MGFVPDQLNATLWDDLEPLYEDLVGRSLDSIEQLENMIKDESELREWVSEAGSRLYVAMTCSTEDDDKKNNDEILNLKQSNLKKPLNPKNFNKKSLYNDYIAWKP